LSCTTSTPTWSRRWLFARMSMVRFDVWGTE
jgi:hypothetical protein